MKCGAFYYPRIKRITFDNFRNIDHGSIDFPNSDINNYLIDEKPSILGLYGQNGSGKSSVIMSLSILKAVLSGKFLTEEYESCIKHGSDKCTLTYVISMYSKVFNTEGESILNSKNNVCFELEYQFSITKTKEKVNNSEYDTSYETVLHIVDEVFKYQAFLPNGERILSKQTFIDTCKTNKDNFFGSKTKMQVYTNNNYDVMQTFRELKAIAYAQSCSFIFMPKTIQLLKESFFNFIQSIKIDDTLIEKGQDILNLKDEKELTNMFSEGVSDEDLLSYQISFRFYNPLEVIDQLTIFGNKYLQVIDTITTGITNINVHLPLLLWSSSDDSSIFRKVYINMNGASYVLESEFDFVKHSIESISDVLNKLVPGLQLNIIDLYKSLSKDGEMCHYFELETNRNGINVPLKYESDGIRRIISILSLLITVYNDSAFTIAIDEIDSGIFEYLLGTILSIMSDSAKGQLIFTSHNLRPLEILPPKFLRFTSPDSKNCFTTLPKRGNTNLRDSYFRCIELDNSDHKIYSSTDKYEIELAFYKAGHREDK